MTKKLISSIPWWSWVIVINLFLMAITSQRFNADFPQAWRLIPAFDLAIEMNLAVWWHGVLLMTASILCYEFYLGKIKGVDKPWLSLSAVFFILAIDEVCSLHERLPHSIGFTIFIPLILFLSIYPLTVLYKGINNHKTFVYIFFGFGFYASVFAQEVIAHYVEFPEWFTPIRIAIEEGCELFGTLIILFGLLKLRSSIRNNSLQKLIPKPPLNTFFINFLWFGLCAQILIYFFALPNMDDLDIRGNPAIFFPTVINFILFCYLFWLSTSTSSYRRVIIFLLSIIFLVSSMGCMYNLLPLIPKAKSFIPEGLISSGYFPLYISQLIGIAVFLALSNKALSTYHVSLIFISACIAIMSSLDYFIDSSYLLIGLFTFSVGLLFAKLDSVKNNAN